MTTNKNKSPRSGRSEGTNTIGGQTNNGNNVTAVESSTGNTGEINDTSPATDAVSAADFANSLSRAGHPIWTRPKGRFLDNWQNLSTEGNDERISRIDDSKGRNTCAVLAPGVFAVVDIDTEDDGTVLTDPDVVEASLRAAGVCIAARVTSGSGGGAHLYVPRSPEHPRDRIKKFPDFPGVDFKTAGLMFLPGSRREKHDYAPYVVEWSNLDAVRNDPDTFRESQKAFTGWLNKHLAPDTTVDRQPDENARLPRTENEIEQVKKQVDVAVSDEVQLIAEAPEGERDEVLIAQVFKLGRYAYLEDVNDGEIISREGVWAKVLHACHENGLTKDTSEDTLRDKFDRQWDAGDSKGRREVPFNDAASDFADNPFQSGSSDSEDRSGDAEDKLFRERLMWYRADKRARRAVEAENAATDGKVVDGGSFLFDQPDKVPALWGRDSEVLWAKGEACMIVGPPGVGKTTITAQVVRGLLGLQDEVLGYPVQPVGKVLYLAMDRPKQIARALARTFSNDAAEHRDEIAQRFIPWEGPPPRDLAQNDDELLAMAQRYGADVVIVDSLKDAAIGLSEDAVGSGYNRARQKVLAAGIDVLELHHQKKSGANGNAPKTLADVYGSTWITSGAGSVVLLWGEAGDAIVELKHLKQPMDSVGPFKVVHDNVAGVSSVENPADPISMAKKLGKITVSELAEAMVGDKPSPNDREAARRKLNGLVRKGLMRKIEDVKNDRNRPVHIYALATPFDTVDDSDTELI